MLGIGLSLWQQSPQSASFDPASLFGASEAGGYWSLDAANVFADTAGSVPITDGATIARINDLSGNNNHLLQATGANRPTWRANGGSPYAEHGGSHWLNALFAVPQPWDRVSAIRQTAFADAEPDRIFGGGAAYGGLLYQFSAINRVVMYSGSNGPQTDDATLNADLIFTEKQANAASRLAVNNGAYATGITGSDAADGITVGADFNGANAIAMRFYGALMIGRALTDPEVTAIRAHLAV